MLKLADYDEIFKRQFKLEIEQKQLPLTDVTMDDDGTVSLDFIRSMDACSCVEFENPRSIHWIRYKDMGDYDLFLGGNLRYHGFDIIGEQRRGAFEVAGDAALYK